ncbi:EamA-like transporter family protein [Tistlia consotensis]|uniref:EamA-like transporter family protein n=1 Tax=Tistlia consotensis USBA 355 TaxID=560819 RepID=A0A1Y6CD60_9PROT|nr:DMT family transporter [Tistlia consotensis]SMF48286.1 EamA-like transporter family protein [Tistlia consotensis USBA 355]SNR81432.1 EamA-like transporter family protein [Tistlia consotensis]
MAAASSLKSLLAALAPAVFVVLWATGFIGAKLGLPYAEPGTFLTLRFLVVVLLMAPLLLVLPDQRLAGWRSAGHVAVVGALMHGVYLGGVFAAIGRGMPAGLASLIVALQPLLTAAVVGPLLGERVRPRQVLGLLLGLLGVGLVLSGKLAPGGEGHLFRGFGLDALAFIVAALLGITTATVYQKRFAQHAPLIGGAVVQYLAAALVVGLPALLFESNRVVWSGEFVFAIGWLVLVLSIGAVSLLMLLIRWGEAAKTASLFYLVPPVTAVIAFLLFDERLGPLALAGMAVTVLGVALVVIRPHRL